MGYKVVYPFKDKVTGESYRVGEQYPHTLPAKKGRIKELSNTNNSYNRAFIKEVTIEPEKVDEVVTLDESPVVEPVEAVEESASEDVVTTEDSEVTTE